VESWESSCGGYERDEVSCLMGWNEVWSRVMMDDDRDE